MLVVREVFRLTQRATQGLIQSLFQLMQVDLPVPVHSTLSRRGRTVAIRLPKRGRGPLHLVLDSSGLKVYGEGEWKVRQHGGSKRRTWRKFHLGVDAESGEVQAFVLSEAGGSDADMVTPLLAQIERPLASAAADGSYDQRKVYAALSERLPRGPILIPPQRNAHIWQHGNTQAPPLPRDENLRYIRAHGRQAWKNESGYHERSLAETAVFRFKTIFGDHLSARLWETQQTQFAARARALNQMTQLGMPDSYKVG